MTVQILDLETVQLGIEATAGTLVPATHVVDFVSATLKIDQKIIRTARSGSLATGHRVDAGMSDYEIEIKTVGTYQRIAFMLAMFIAPTITGTGASADKTWTFSPSDVADNLKTCSLETGGADTWPTEFLLAGCKGKKVTIHITREGLWEITWTFTGQKLTTGSKTGSLTAATGLVDILGYTTKVYIDASTVHSTQPGTLLTADITIELGTTPRHYLGSTTGEAGSIIQTSRRKVSLDLVGSWAATTEYLAFRAATERKISLDSVGAVLGGSNYEARLDFYGMWDSWDMDNEGGEITQKLSGTAVYDGTAALDVKATIVNDKATID